MRSPQHDTTTVQHRLIARRCKCRRDRKPPGCREYEQTKVRHSIDVPEWPNDRRVTAPVCHARGCSSDPRKSGDDNILALELETAIACSNRCDNIVERDGR